MSMSTKQENLKMETEEGFQLYVNVSITRERGGYGSLNVNKTLSLGPLTFEQLGKLFGKLDNWAEQIRQAIQ